MHAYLFSPTLKTWNDSTLSNLRQVVLAFPTRGKSHRRCSYRDSKNRMRVLKRPRRKNMDRQEADAEEVQRWRGGRLRQRTSRSIRIHLEDADRRGREAPFRNVEHSPCSRG